ncbi:hypothetical protein CABS02_13372 [Colletotrichum abscissum]|uniref:Uncharacterized protein n=1 Tax=Colletotrichum abscissum TaxID=1671311 RepID=A0A9Q0AYG7_9PEZI|nr:hypothetical protein CABS02_13372 [Colletotrichum abscissum]
MTHQYIANLQGRLEILRRTIEGHQCGLASAASFLCNAITSIDYIESIVASLAQDLSPRPVKTSRSGASCFQTLQFHPPVPDTTGELAAFCRSIPRVLQDWKRKRHTLGLTTTDGIRAVFFHLILPNGRPTALQTTANQHALDEHYVASLSGDKRAPCAGLSVVRDLVFFGECRVALELDTTVAKVDEVIEQYMSNINEKKTSQHYRNVPRKITRWMDQLYGVCGCAVFELFLHAERTIANYDTLARSSQIDTAFPKHVQPLIPTELCKKDTPPKLTFYIPFLVWASIRLTRNEDLFDNVRKAFGTKKFEHSDFRRCLSSLCVSPPQVSPVLAQPARNDRTAGIDTIGSRSTCTERAAPGSRKRKRKSDRPPTCPPPEPVAPHYMQTEYRTEGSESRSSDPDRLGHQRLGTVNVSYSGGQQLPVRCDNIAHSSTQTAFSDHTMPCNPRSLSIGQGQPEQLLELPGVQDFPNYAQAAGGVDVLVTRYGLGRPDWGSAGIMDNGSVGAALACIPGGLSNQFPWYTGALGNGAAVDTVWVEMNTGSGQIGGVRQCSRLPPIGMRMSVTPNEGSEVDEDVIELPAFNETARLVDCTRLHRRSPFTVAP